MYEKNYTEREVYRLFEGHISIPPHFFIPIAGSSGDISDETVPSEFLNHPAVVKISSPSIVHKSDRGGVLFLEELTPESLRRAVRKLEENLGESWSEVEGVLVAKKIEFPSRMGQQLYFGAKFSREFGYLFSVGMGGLSIEELNVRFREGQASALFHPEYTSAEELRAKLRDTFFFRAVTGQIRGYPKLLEPEEFLAQLEDLSRGVRTVIEGLKSRGERVLELEFNPLVIEGGELLPLDGVLRVEGEVEFGLRGEVSVPVERLSHFLYPNSIAIAGISLKNPKNVGRIILKNLLDMGFDRERLYLIRPGIDSFEGVRCYSSAGELPQPVDLMILAVSAGAVPGILEELFAQKKARAVLLIPGGMGETREGKSLEGQIRNLLRRYAEDPERPILLGNNSLGLSTYGLFDSLFIPPEKLPRRGGKALPMAFLSQSGAFIITRIDRILHGSPRFQVSLGNQLDAGCCDFVEFISREDSVRTFAIYSEGLKDGDGRRLAELIRRGVERGREFILYKAGRTPRAKEAIAGHTASIVGDYRAFREVLEDAGGLVADSFEEFTDLMMLASSLGDKEFAGNRAFFISNAGYESVGMIDNSADNSWPLELAELSSGTEERVRAILSERGLDKLVNVQNPLDITPMADDGAHLALIEAALDDSGVDLGVFGNVPYTVMVQTLPAGVLEGEDLLAENGYSRRIVELFKRSKKPFALVIDGGKTYDPLFYFLKEKGLPVFRSADRAVRAMAKYANYRLKIRARQRS